MIVFQGLYWGPLVLGTCHAWGPQEIVFGLRTPHAKLPSRGKAPQMVSAIVGNGGMRGGALEYDLFSFRQRVHVGVL